MSRRRVLITGATGFLGGALARALIAEGDDVRGLGRDAARGAELARAGVAFAACDLAAGALPAAMVESIDTIVHCAARSSDWGSRAAFAAANIEATRHVLDAAARHAIPHVVMISSSSVTFRFRDQLGVREDMALPKPVNLYAWSKAEAERLALAARVRTTILRPRGIYGRGDTALLPRLLAACDRGPLPLARGGGAIIDLTHVDDVVAAIRAVLRAPPARRLYNVSGGEAVPVRHIVEESAARAGRRVRWRRVPWPVLHAGARAAEAVYALRGAQDGPRVTAYAAGLFAFSQTLDINAIAADTGWRPAVPFDEGLRRTFADEALA